jgi:foldase protein PrsA
MCVFLSAMLMIVAVVSGCGSQATEEKKQTNEQSILPLDTTSKKVIGEYQGGKITEGELNKYINIMSFLDQNLNMMLSMPDVKNQLNSFKAELLKSYAAEKYLASKAKPAKTYAKQVDNNLKQLDAQYKSTAQGNNQSANGQSVPKSLDEAIKGKGFSKEDLKQLMLRSMQVEEQLNTRLKGEQYDYVKVQHVLVSVSKEGQSTEEGQTKRTDAEAKKRIEEVKKKLDAGESFDKIAKQYSDDTGSKEKGGIIEGAADSFVPQFAKASKTLELNKISDPIKTDYGYHVLKVLERSKKPYDQMPQEYKSQKQQEVFTKIIDQELKMKSFIKVAQAKK